MTVIVAGGTGFIGRALCAALTREGYDVALLSRSKGKGTLTWREVKAKGLPPCEAVINLAGSSVLEKGKDWRRNAFNSRLKTTRLLVEAIKKSPMPPKVLINASAVGYYPALIDETWTEDSEVEADEFVLCEMTHAWEAVAHELDGHPTRLALMRIGVVLGRGGGALERMVKPFSWGLGGKIGTGYQAFPWIHIDDLVALFLFVMRNDGASGPFNAVAPHCVTNAQFTHALGKALHRPTLLAVPAFALRWLMGERAEMLLYGQWVVPKRAVEMGFTFAFERVESALDDLVRRRR